MTGYRLSMMPIGVKDNFQEGDQDGLQRSLRAVCGGGASVCDASGVDGEHLRAGQAGRVVSQCGGIAVRTRVAVLLARQSDKSGGLSNFEKGPRGVHGSTPADRRLSSGRLRKA